MINTYTEPHPRLIKSNPWNSVDTAINELLDKIIFEENPGVVDDDIPDMIDDPEQRKSAIKILQDRLSIMIGDL